MPCISALLSWGIILGTQPPCCEEAQTRPFRDHMKGPFVGVAADSQCQPLGM